MLGAILRINVDGDSVAGTQQTTLCRGRRREVYVLGLRNPWRFSFDPATDALWIADVGEGAFDEVDRLDPDANLGWGAMEGNHWLQWRTLQPRRIRRPADRVWARLGMRRHRRLRSSRRGDLRPRRLVSIR
jgi:glucose/arabinose dehydrogenase